MLSLEIWYQNSFIVLLKPPKDDIDNDILSLFLKQVLKKSTTGKTPYYLIGDLNISY